MSAGKAAAAASACAVLSSCATVEQSTSRGHDMPAKKILLMDPAYGLVAVSQNRLLNSWRGQNYAALVCARSAPPGGG